MPSFPRRLATPAIAASLLLIAWAPGVAGTAPTAPVAGLTAPASLTVGNLARLVVSEVAVNAPSGGFDAVTSLGVLASLGYSGGRSTGDPATIGDLQGMLATLGVRTSAARPGDALTDLRASATLETVRGSLPKFEVPEGGNGRSDRPNPCVIEFLECKRDCQEASPSGTGGRKLGGCIQECQAARKECSRDLRAARP